ncbi:hypothetical protein TIFTF001_010219 [Ficus carica]|uniref:Uncharacterized protein n=1 Tax=Ficus carica TaxID=3494 RepID=A0AA87ZW36_FICCA|nr:hypothetical protein TIFTF001_010219 [Ficus carica]
MEATALLKLPLILFLSFTINGVSASHAIIPGVYRNGTCWLQREIDLVTYETTGLPVKFSPVEPSKYESIHESTDLNIKFSDELSPTCGGSSVLKVGELEEEFVSLGGVEEDRSSWFKIEKFWTGESITTSFFLAPTCKMAEVLESQPDSVRRIVWLRLMNQLCFNSGPYETGSQVPQNEISK